ncbi:MAG: CRTAC1 family protein, partial [Planctomycetaceae bacterium]|nr:CRTAC1 family protein [Planctomycetaceae bacterium]
VVNYVQDDMRQPKLCPRPESPDGYLQCSPTQYSAENDWLLLSDGAGGWRDITLAAGITGVDGKGLGVVVADFNGDGRLDIYVANDGMPNFLYVRQSTPDETTADPVFADEALILGCAVNASGVAESSMGIAAGDCDRDGDLDLHITNFYAEPNVLYENMAGNGFLDATIPSRLGSYSRSTMGWGTTFLDADNDGWLDLFVANGHVDDYMWVGNNEPYGIPPQFFWNRTNKTFADVSRQCGATFTQPAFGRGVARCDLNRDGRLDVIMTDTEQPSQVLLNETSDNGHYMQVRLVGTGLGNRDAIGARVIADGDGSSQLQTLDGGGSFQSHNETLLHFGLGEATQCPQLTINWPNGTKSEFADVAADRSYLAVQGDEQLYLQP